MDELEQHFELMRQRKLKQNQRCIAAGKPLRWPKLQVEPPKPGKGASRAGKGASAKLPLPESGDVDDSQMSYDEWQACGFTIKKGEKARGFDPLGVAQFDLTQVHRINPAWANYRKRK